MISEIFYSKEINTSKQQYIYEEDYLIYYLSKKLNSNGPSEDSKLKQWIMELTEVTNINKKRFDIFLSHFNISGSLYTIDENKKYILNKVSEFNSNFLFVSWEPQDMIYKHLCSFIGQQQIDLSSALPWMFALDKIKSNKNQDYYSYLYFRSLYHFEKNYTQFDMCICNVDEDYKKLTIDFVFNDKLIVDIMFANGISTIKDLTDLSVPSLLVLFAINPEINLAILNELTVDFKSSYESKILSVFERPPPMTSTCPMFRASIIPSRAKLSFCILTPIRRQTSSIRAASMPLESPASSSKTNGIYSSGAPNLSTPASFTSVRLSAETAETASRSTIKIIHNRFFFIKSLLLII